jgi:hypothetical protein
MSEKWWYAVDEDGRVTRKSTNHTYLSEVARLKGWKVTDKPDITVTDYDVIEDDVIED